MKILPKARLRLLTSSSQNREQVDGAKDMGGEGMMLVNPEETRLRNFPTECFRVVFSNTIRTRIQSKRLLDICS